MDDLDSEWQRKGATLSDKTARKEFGLTQDEVVQAIRAGKLHYREASMHGNPWLRLLRREVEALVKKKHGDDYLKDQRAKTELAGINRKLKQMKTQVAALEERAVASLAIRFLLVRRFGPAAEQPIYILAGGFIAGSALTSFASATWKLR